MGKTMTFTGPRPVRLYGYNDDAKYAGLCEKIAEQITSYANEGFDTFITGGAQGADQLIAQAVESVKLSRPNIKSIIYVPMENQSAPWSTYGRFGKTEYNAILAMADEVRILSPAPKDKHQAIKLLHARNEKMLEDADELTVILPPNISKEQIAFMHKGGTVSCYRTALAAKMPVRFIQA